MSVTTERIGVDWSDVVLVEMPISVSTVRHMAHVTVQHAVSRWSCPDFEEC